VPQSFFTPATFDYLRDLTKNNRKAWFDTHKAKYEREVKAPALAFIEAAGPRLAKISPEIVADPRPVGGSLMRVYRDTRFSKDKTPYKTNIGMGFGHRKGREAAAPGYYLNIGLDQEWGNFSGGGIHMAETKTLGSIRDAIVKDSTGWKAAAHNRKLEATHEYGSDALKRPPQGYPPDHAFVEDLKRKGYFAHAKYSADDVVSPNFLDRFIENCKIEAPLLVFLAHAVGVPW
jgi:uncharacterized protein (TIGR02453 family)